MGRVRRINRRAGVLWLSGMLSLSSLQANERTGMFSPYLGAEFQTRYFGFNEAQGGNVFPKRNHPYRQWDLFVGVKLFEGLGLEFGYESARSKLRRAVNTAETLVLGFPRSPGSEASINQDKIYGGH